MIPFNRPYIDEEMEKCVLETLRTRKIAGDGVNGQRVEKLLETELSVKKALLTTSGTHALEMAAILLDLKAEDEIIVPSFTFVTSALAFLMHGAKLVFCDIRDDTLNIDESKLSSLINSNTRAVVAVHYAGVSCEMDEILDIAKRNNIFVIEDNAHGLYGSYKGKRLGSIGDLSILSFHETKNFTSGEGGALLINSPKFIERSEIIREKGTNRSQFFKGMVDKYTWVDKGSSYVMSDILASLLYSQINRYQKIQNKRMDIWNKYYLGLSDWAKKMDIRLPFVPSHCDHSAHMFYLLMKNEKDRDRFISEMKKVKINTVFHFQPLHLTDIAKNNGGSGYSDCPVTMSVSSRLVRLPFFTDLSGEELDYVIEQIQCFSV